MILIISIILLLLGIMFDFGKGEFLIAGFNTLPKQEKDKYDLKKLMKFLAKIMYSCGVCTLLCFVGVQFNIPFLLGIGIVLILVICFFALFYVNGGDRFMKK